MPMYTWSETGSDYIVQAKKTLRGQRSVDVDAPSSFDTLPPDLAPCVDAQVAGLHRAVPSTALDKAIYLRQSKHFTVC